MEQPPAIFDGFYKIVGELGRGTTGIVYEGWHTALNRRIAIKVPAVSIDAEQPAKAQRFLRECQALAYLTSGKECNIPRLLVVAECRQGRPYSVREFVEGSTLERRTADRSIDLRTGLTVVAEVARIVEWVHGQGFVHRNLSPANVLVAEDGTPWLIGFGRVALRVGTHMAPAGGGTPVDVDARGLQELLWWLCDALRHPVPASLEGAAEPGSATTARAFGEAVVSALRDF